MATAQESFVGRVAELDALARAYAQALDGRFGIVCVEGPAGIGKTALIRAFLAATAAGSVIVVSGDEAEMTLPWGTISQLALGSRAAGAGPLGQLGQLSPGADPLAAGRLLLDSLGELAARGPVVLVMEDLHWIDHPSAQALRFALRRLGSEPVLAVLTTRREGPAQLDEGWRRLLDDRGVRLRLQGLAWPEVAQLVSALGGVTLSGPAVRRLWRHTCGNPLYTRCLIEELEPATLRAGWGPLPAPQSYAALLLARLAACGQPARDLADAAAVLGERCALAQAASVAELADPAEALGEAVAARLLAERTDEDVCHIEFTHPLARAAIYSGLTPARRGALHRSAARITGSAVALGHRVAAASAPDARLADELAARADAELARGFHAAAARHLMNAADLSPDRQPREDRLLAACQVWLRSGAVYEVSSRRELLESMTPSPRLDHIRGFLAHLEGRPEEARTALRAALDQLQAASAADTLAGEAAHRLAGLAVFDWDWPAALALLDSVPDASSRLSLLIRCIALTMAGQSGEARRLLDAARRTAGPGGSGVVTGIAGGFVEAWSDHPGAARRDLEAIVARPDGFGGSLRPTAHWLLADAYYRLGALDDAIVSADLARSLLAGAGRAVSPEISMAFATGAYAAAARGDRTGARALVAAAQARARPAASKFERAAAGAAQWAVAVALDDPDQMLAAADAFAAAADAPELCLFPFGPVLAEALWRNGRLHQAAAELTAYEAVAGRLGRDSALVAAARVRGLVEADRHDAEAALRAFRSAVPAAESLPQPLEAARFKTAYGTVLARIGMRAAAAEQAAGAYDLCERAGARPYLQRAGHLLERLDRRVRPRAGGGRLTATESVVARLVASGLSNRQVAERLMVSRKAVEFHLANIYAKLQVSSRSQLAARRDVLGTLGAAETDKA